MVMGRGPSADDIRRQMATAKMGSIMGDRQQRLKTKRQPGAPPVGPVPLESPKPSTAGETGQLVGAIGATAVGIAVAAGMNPVLGIILGLAATQLGSGVGGALARDEHAAAADVQVRNRRRMAEAALERQRYEVAREKARPEMVPGPGMRAPMMPQPGEEVAPGGTDKLKSMLLA